jgi:uncharacterized damage-inducible protein DinB
MSVQQHDLHLLVGFNAWADTRVLELARQLTSEQIHAKQPMGFGTVFETLVHIMGAERTWLTRWQGSSPSALPPAANYQDLDQLEVDWRAVHKDLRAFINAVDNDTLHANLTYQNTKGESFTQPLIWLILHTMNHSTEHRTQIAAICTMAGHDTGPLDLIHYIRTVLPTPKNYV